MTPVLALSNPRDLSYGLFLDMNDLFLNGFLADVRDHDDLVPGIFA